MERRGDFIAGILIGGMIGAVIGILYAPKSGKETREDIARKADELLAKQRRSTNMPLKKAEKLTKKSCSG